MQIQHIETHEERSGLQAMSAAAAILSPAALALPIEMCAPIRRIVSFHSGSLRELLFTLPALKALRETFEGAPICAVVREGLAPLLESCALVDEVLARPEGGLSSQATLMAKLHAHHFDMALAFSTSRKSTLLAWSSGAPIRVGFDGAKMDALLTHRVEKENDAPLSIDAFLDLTRAVGCAPRCHDYADILQPAPRFEQEAALFLKERKIAEPFLILAPQIENARPRDAGAGSTPDWAQVVAALSPRWPIVFIGAKANRALLRAAREIAAPEKVHDAGGELEIAPLAALCGQARLFIGHAGGYAHLCAAMKTPVVALCADEKLREVCEPRGVPHRLLGVKVGTEEIARAARELIGL